MDTKVTDEQLIEIHNELIKTYPNRSIRSWMIKDMLKSKLNIEIDESTIRGRFIIMNKPLSGTQKTDKITINKTYKTANHLLDYVPKEDEFNIYVERPIDKIISLIYDLDKYPITQGKQGTGKTYAHKFYAYKKGLPFFLFSCHEDMKLNKLFGDRTIQNGSVIFQESILVQACNNPSLILFDEINAVNTKQTFDWHALLENRELYIKDVGKAFKLHPDTKIGFAQNPKSAKYIGGNILPSNFLGRCIFVTFPEFTEKELKNAINKKFTNKLQEEEIDKFVLYYIKLNEVIERAKLPIDVSIRQLNNVIQLIISGLPLATALEIGIINMLDSISQPTAKDALAKLSMGIWKELCPPQNTPNPDKVKWTINHIGEIDES